MSTNSKFALIGLLGTMILAGCGSDDSKSNRAPVANAGGNQSVKQNVKVTLDGSKSSDPDGDPLTYKWSIKTQPQGSTLNVGDTTKTASITPAVVGDYEVQLTVSDGNLSASATTKISVSAATANGKPVAKAGSDVRALINTNVALDGSKSSDPDQDPLTYKWTVKTKPTNSTAKPSDDKIAKPTIKPDLAGDYVVSLVVNDGKLDSDPSEVKIKAVATNAKPVADAGPATANVAVNVDLALDASDSSDADGDDLTYAWSITDKPTGSTPAVADAAKKATSFKADKAGTYKVQLVVDDGIAKSDPVTVTVTVQ